MTTTVEIIVNMSTGSVYGTPGLLYWCPGFKDCILSKPEYLKLLRAREVYRRTHGDEVYIIYESELPFFPEIFRGCTDMLWKHLLDNPEAFEAAIKYRNLWVVRYEDYRIHSVSMLLPIGDFGKRVPLRGMAERMYAEVVESGEHIMRVKFQNPSKTEIKYFGANHNFYGLFICLLLSLPAHMLRKTVPLFYDYFKAGDLDGAIPSFLGYLEYMEKNRGIERVKQLFNTV